MVEWSEKLFVSDKAKKKLKKIKKKLEKPDKIRFGAYLITLNTGESDLLDIYNILMFPARHFKKDEYDATIVGVAKSENDAMELAGRIMESVLKEKNEISRESVLSYFSDKKKSALKCGKE